MRMCLTVEYDGSRFQGFQRQRGRRTVQGELEKALSEIANHPIQIHCAGRTDAGVHAIGQVIHFDCEVERQQQAWVMGSNTLLPKDIAIRNARIVSEQFHARFSALSRTYRYYIACSPYRSALLTNFVLWEFKTLDIAAMQQAADFLVGEQNFSSFRSSECQSHSPFRRMDHILIRKEQHPWFNLDVIVIELKANAFLHHMVRNIVGTLLPVGKHLKPYSWMQEVLAAKNRSCAGVTASPCGLYLVDVEYTYSLTYPLIL